MSLQKKIPPNRYLIVPLTFIFSFLKKCMNMFFVLTAVTRGQTIITLIHFHMCKWKTGGGSNQK